MALVVAFVWHLPVWAVCAVLSVEEAVRNLVTLRDDEYRLAMLALVQVQQPDVSPRDFLREMAAQSDETQRTMFPYVWPFLLVVLLVAVAVALLVSAWRSWNGGRFYGRGWRFDDDRRPWGRVVAGLLALVAAVASGWFGYLRLSEALRPYGLTLGSVLLVVVLLAALALMHTASQDRDR